MQHLWQARGRGDVRNERQGHLRAVVPPMRQAGVLYLSSAFGLPQVLLCVEGLRGAAGRTCTTGTDIEEHADGHEEVASGWDEQGADYGRARRETPVCPQDPTSRRTSRGLGDGYHGAAGAVCEEHLPHRVVLSRRLGADEPVGWTRRQGTTSCTTSLRRPTTTGGGRHSPPHSSKT